MTKKRKKSSKPKRSEKQIRLDNLIQSFADHLRCTIQYELNAFVSDLLVDKFGDKLDEIEYAFREYARDFITDYKEVELEFGEEE